MNLKCKQRQCVNIGEYLLIGRMDKCQNGMSRKTVKFQAVWSYSGSYLPAHSYVEDILYATKVPWSKGMCEAYRSLADCPVLFSCVAP